MLGECSLFGMEVWSSCCWAQPLAMNMQFSPARLKPESQKPTCHHARIATTKTNDHKKEWELIKRKLRNDTSHTLKRVFPVDSLESGKWVKLICGASFEDVADIRNLSLVYTLAGVDCIDCAADASVVTAVNEGIEIAGQIILNLEVREDGLPFQRPWVMISVNDGEDIHFRKAYFDPEDCPEDCSRPCELVCPADAIRFQHPPSPQNKDRFDASLHKIVGVNSDRCYGCGRCLPVCPYDKIRENFYIRDNVAVLDLLQRDDVDAIEIHSSVWHLDSFREFWNKISNATKKLKLISVSFPYAGDATIHALKDMYTIMKPCLTTHNIWQLDCRPMSGDIGKGSTRDARDYAVAMAARTDIPPGFLQLAGGTNHHTVNLLRESGLLHTNSIAGVAYGGYARKVVGKVLHNLSESLGSQNTQLKIEKHPEFLLQALEKAISLVGPIKCHNNLA